MAHTTRNRANPPRVRISGGSTGRADVEYSIMLAVLNFQRDFMQSNYSAVSSSKCNG